MTHGVPQGFNFLKVCVNYTEGFRSNSCGICNYKIPLISFARADNNACRSGWVIILCMSIFDRRVLIALLNRGKMAASPLRVSACVLAAITVCLLVAQASAAAGKK